MNANSSKESFKKLDFAVSPLFFEAFIGANFRGIKKRKKNKTHLILILSSVRKSNYFSRIRLLILSKNSDWQSLRTYRGEYIFFYAKSK